MLAASRVSATILRRRSTKRVDEHGDCTIPPTNASPFRLHKITEETHAGRVVRQDQYEGRIVRANRSEGVVIQRPSGEELKLPPDLRAFFGTRAGQYRFRSSGHVVADPDLQTAWTRTLPPPA
jgi:hypothetical protein